MSDKERKVADRIFSAAVSVETARTVLQVTTEHFRLCETDLPKEDRQTIGLSVEAIGTMLNVVDNYMFRAIDALDEKGGAADE